MSEVGDMWRDVRDERFAAKLSRRSMEAETFDSLAKYAREVGLELKQCSQSHYQLTCQDPAWLLNIYPGNRRLYWDPNRRGPFLKVEEPWCIRNVIIAATKARQKQRHYAKRNRK